MADEGAGEGGVASSTKELTEGGAKVVTMSEGTAATAAAPAEPAAPALQFQWDQIPSSGAPTGPIWKSFYPADNELLTAGFESAAGSVSLPRGFTVNLPEKEQTASKDAPKPVYEDIPAEELGTNTHDRSTANILILIII